MSYNPQSDLVALKARSIIKTFDASVSGEKNYGVILTEEATIETLLEELPSEATFEESPQYDIVVCGNSDLGIVRT